MQTLKQDGDTFLNGAQAIKQEIDAIRKKRAELEGLISKKKKLLISTYLLCFNHA